MTALLLAGLGAFCVVFAINSSIHSYLIVRYSGGDKVASSVGFYYMSNAAGRFVGTLCSGAIYQYAHEDKAYGLGCDLAERRLGDAGLCLKVSPVADGQPRASLPQVLLRGIGGCLPSRDDLHDSYRRPSGRPPLRAVCLRRASRGRGWGQRGAAARQGGGWGESWEGEWRR